MHHGTEITMHAAFEKRRWKGKYINFAIYFMLAATIPQSGVSLYVNHRQQ